MGIGPSPELAAVVAAVVADHPLGTVLDEVAAQRLTVALDIDVPRMVTAADAATAAAVVMPGERVVVKVVGPAHKTEHGGVQVVANHPDAIAAAAARIGAAPGGFLVAEHVDHDPGAELLAGVRWTDAFGPVVTIGSGGVAAVRDAAPAAISPATAARIETSLTTAPGVAPLLASWRGATPAATARQLATVARTLVALGVAEMPHHLLEFEINPLVFAADGRPLALDALAVVGGAAAPVIRPRPSGAIARQLHPRSIAVMGVSQGMNPGRVILRNILGAGYPADRVTVIKPGLAEIDGCRCVRDPAALAEPVDLLVMALDAAAIPEAIAQVVSSAAARSVVLIPGGLGEVAGTERAARVIRRLLDGTNGLIGVTGPNSMGLRSTPGGYDATFIPPERMTQEHITPPLWGSRRGAAPAVGGETTDRETISQVPTAPAVGGQAPLAVIAQSGAFTLSRLDRLPWLRPRYVVSVGNQLDLTSGDYLEHFAGDPAVAIAACYLEGFVPGDGDRFLRAAQRMRSRGGMVLWYRGGRTTTGATAAATHTAAIATDDLVARSLGAVSGILDAESLDDFDDLLRLATRLHHKPLDGSRVAVVSNAGFECVAAADAMGDLTPARFAPDTLERLRFVLGESGLTALTTIDNPLDLTPMAGAAAYLEAATAILDDPGVDVAVIGCVPFTPALATLPDQVDDAGSLPGHLAALASHPKPWVAVVDGGRLYDPMADRLEAAGIPVLRAMDRAVRLLGRYAAVRTRPHR